MIEFYNPRVHWPGNANLFLVPTDIQEKKQLFAFLRHALEFPNYFSENWDSLEECLNDMSWGKHPEVVLFHQDIPLSLKPQEAEIYLSIVCRAEQPIDSTHVRFAFQIDLQHEVSKLIDAGAE